MVWCQPQISTANTTRGNCAQTRERRTGARFYHLPSLHSKESRATSPARSPAGYSAPKFIHALLELSVEVELTIEAEKSYREPPPPEQSLVPEAAYKPRGNKEKQAPLKVSAFPASNPPVAGGEGQSWIATLSKMLAQEVKLALQPTMNNAQPLHLFRDLPLPRRKRGKQEGRRMSEQAARRNAIRDLGSRRGRNRLIAVQRNRRVIMKGFIVTAAVCQAIARIIALRARETGKRARRQGRRAAPNPGGPA